MIAQIFFSYSHEDEELMHKVRQQLIPFERGGLLVKWYDRKIQAGQEWDMEIKEQLFSAQIILLLISPDFIESKYIYNLEMKEALKRHEKGDAVVIRVILRPCLWQDMPIGKLQALPKDGKAITTWGNLDEATMNVAAGIVQVVRSVNSR